MANDPGLNPVSSAMIAIVFAWWFPLFVSMKKVVFVYFCIVCLYEYWKDRIDRKIRCQLKLKSMKSLNHLKVINQTYMVNVYVTFDSFTCTRTYWRAYDMSF